MESLDIRSEESHELSRKSVRVAVEIKKAFFKSNNFRIENNSGKEHITIENKWDLLKEFRFSQSIVNISLTPEYE